MNEMTLMVNTVIAIAVHATAALDQEPSISWLCGIKELSLDEYNKGRGILGINDPVRRNTVESAASDIVRYIKEGNPISKTFVIDPTD